ncbi:MAG: aspartate carbamoyltransferase regulatory subunit [Bacilli bacterium]|nr:aspartate carbamoyltransferase regulatory subunit [Bacilli bacterium]
MNIDTIKNGYVIDHITAGNAIKIYRLLNLEKLDLVVALITNVKSNKTKTKDLLKIGKLIDIDLDKIAFIDPDVTINIVKNNKIIEKKKLELPERLINVCKCNNPRCITSTERNLDQIFNLTDKENKVYRCNYCEMMLEKDKFLY